MVRGSCGVDTGALGFLAGFAWALSVALDLLSAAVGACLLNPDSLALLPWVLRVQVHEGDLWQRGCSWHWREKSEFVDVGYSVLTGGCCFLGMESEFVSVCAVCALIRLSIRL